MVLIVHNLSQIERHVKMERQACVLLEYDVHKLDSAFRAVKH